MITANLFIGAAENNEELIEEVGTLVFQSALMYYMAAHTDEEVDVFERYVVGHVETESFMDDLCSEFPEFEQVLMVEMRAFQQEVLA